MRLLKLLQASDPSASRSASCLFSALTRSQLKMQAVAQLNKSSSSSSSSSFTALPSTYQQTSSLSRSMSENNGSRNAVSSVKTADFAAVSIESYKNDEDEGDDHMEFDEEEGAPNVTENSTSSSLTSFASSILNPVVRKSIVSLWRFAGMSAKEYFSAETSAAMYGLRHIIHHSRVMFNVSSFPLLPRPRIPRYSSPYGSPSPPPRRLSAVSVALPRCRVDEIPSGTLVWVAPRRSEGSLLSDLVIAGDSFTSTHSALSMTAASLLGLSRAVEMTLTPDTANLGLFAKVVRHFSVQSASSSSSSSSSFSTHASTTKYFLEEGEEEIEDTNSGSDSPLSRNNVRRHDVLLSSHQIINGIAPPKSFSSTSDELINMTTVCIRSSHHSEQGVEFVDIPSSWLYIVRNKTTSDADVISLLPSYSTVATTSTTLSNNAESSNLHNHASASLQNLENSITTVSLSTSVKIARACLLSVLISFPAHIPFSTSLFALFTTSNSDDNLFISSIEARRGEKQERREGYLPGQVSLLKLLTLVTAEEVEGFTTSSPTGTSLSMSSSSSSATTADVESGNESGISNEVNTDLTSSLSSSSSSSSYQSNCGFFYGGGPSVTTLEYRDIGATRGVLGLGSSLSAALLGTSPSNLTASSPAGSASATLMSSAQGGMASVSYSSTLRSLYAQIAAAEEAHVPYFHPAILLSSSSFSSSLTSSLSATKDMRRVWLCKTCDAIIDSEDASFASQSFTNSSSNSQQEIILQRQNAASTSSMTPLCSHCNTPAPPLPLVSSQNEQYRSQPLQSQYDPSSSLATILVNDSLVSLSLAADSCARAGARTVSKSSSHPLASMTENFEVGSVFFGANPGSSSNGTTSLWMTFDPRCSTDPSDDSSYVLIFACESDPSVTNQIGTTRSGVSSTSYSPLKAARGLELKKRAWAKTLQFASQFEGAEKVIARLLSAGENATSVYGNGSSSGGGGGVQRSREGVQSLNSSSSSSSSTFSSCRLIACLSGPAHMFQPLMISNCDSLLWVIAKGRASPGRSLRQSVPDGGWGMQFTVTPFTDITWGSERSVPRSASLLWAFYQFDFLLSGSSLSHELLTKGTLHNGKLIAAFFDYLRTSGAPFKEKVVLFLHSLFTSPEYLLITPSHVDYSSWGTKQTVEMIKTLNVSSSFLMNNPAIERLLLQRITCLPLDAADLIRFIALDMKSKAEQANVMFLPRQLQQLLELAAAAECALKRARIQLQVLCATRGEIYESMEYKGNGLLIQLNGGGTASSTSNTLLSGKPFLPLPMIADSARVIFATSARCDASVPAFSPSHPFDLQTASSGQPPLMLVKPQLISTMTEVEALSHLRDLLLSLVTGRRVPDAWILRATLLATRLDPNDVSGLSTDLIWRAHHACSSFSIPEDEATVALMVSYSARLNLGGSLEIQPSRFEMTEADASSYPLLDKFRVKKNDGSDDVCGFALRIRMSIILVINSLLKRCIQYIDMSWSSDDANLTAFSSSTNNNSRSSSSSSSSSTSSTSSVSGSSLHYLHTLSVGAMLRRIPHLILVDAKENLIQKAIDATEHSAGGSGSIVKVLIDNQKAMASAEHNVLDPLYSLCTFAQLTRYMIESKVGDRLMRCKLTEREILFEVSYVSLTGEHEEGMDWGGMYRDTLSRCMEDLFGDSPGIDLFTLSPNAAASRSIDDTGATPTVGGGGMSPGLMMSNMSSTGAGGSGGVGGAGRGGLLLPPMVTSVGDGMFLPNPRYCPANITPGSEASSFPFFSSTNKVPKGRPMMASTTSGSSSFMRNPILATSSTSVGTSSSSSHPSSSSSSTSTSSGSSAVKGGSDTSLSISPQLLALVSTMYAWVGRVFGIAIRTHASDLEADLSAVVWKLLVDEPLTLIDISSIDSALGGHLLRVFNWEFDAKRAQQLRQERKEETHAPSSFITSESSNASSSSSSSSSSSISDQQHRSNNSFMPSSAGTLARDAEIAFREEFGNLRFLLPASSLTGYPLPRFDATTTTSSEQSSSSYITASQVVSSGWCCITQHESIPLTPLGANELVSASQASRSKYVSLVVQACIAPYQYQVACMRHGMAAVVPSRALALCGWRDMLRLVCGDAAIDIENLYRNTKYDSNKYYHEQHPVIINFWKAMRELTPEQKRNFVRFAWGRSRLPRGKWPINSSGAQVKFTIVPRKGHLTGIPLSHTCFFLIELPEYPTLALLRKNLLLAITYGAGEGFLIA